MVCCFLLPVGITGVRCIPLADDLVVDLAMSVKLCGAFRYMNRGSRIFAIGLVCCLPMQFRQLLLTL